MIIQIFACLALTILARGQNDQSGFISIDSGIDEGSDYDDETTGLRYTSDTKYIDTGGNGNISPNFSSSTLSRQLSTVRSFPEGVRNCYTLSPVNKDDKYLIRASFMYGNYDNKNQTPEFSVHIDANEWAIVTFARASSVMVWELIYVASANYVDVCLVNTGLGTPFISTLELRPLNGSIYQTQSGSLDLYARLNIGSTSNETIRYRDDAYDRVWYPYNAPSSLEVINSSFSSDLLSSTEYKLPPMVMQTALQPRNESKSLRLSWKIEDATEKFYVYLHFAEVQSLQEGDVRELYVTLNDDYPFGPPFGLTDMKPVTLQSTHSLSGDHLTFTISKTGDSTLPPILNALEIYRILQFQQLSTNQDDVASMKKIKQVYSIDRNWNGDPCVPKNYIWNGLNCTASGYDSPSIIALNLSSSRLTGKIDSSFLNLKFLESLDLSNNSLYGSVPDFSQLSSLRVLNLSWNKLTGSLPAALLARVDNSSFSLSVEGNPDLCLTRSCKKENKVIIPVIASVGSFLVVASASLAILWMVKRRQLREDVLVESKDWLFTYAEVVNITNNFEKAIGKGGFGTVYSGHLMDGTQVAVKMLSPASIQGSKEFRTEAQLLTRIHHRNLASLIGYCDEGSNMGLIYEYMAKGNLQDQISEGNPTVLSWEQRLQIAVDTAQGLDYLHNGCKPPIIHRDVKSANILLDENFQAKVADFGLCRILPSSATHASTAIVGTPGYLDPEYYINSRLSERSDVYSFGIVLLELITGQPAILKDLNKTHLVQWVSSMLERGDIRNIVDPRLCGNFATNSVWKTLETAMACVPLTSIQRPTISQVLMELKGCLEMEVAREKRKTDEDHDSELPRSISMEMVPIGPEMTVSPEAR